MESARGPPRKSPIFSYLAVSFDLLTSIWASGREDCRQLYWVSAAPSGRSTWIFFILFSWRWESDESTSEIQKIQKVPLSREQIEHFSSICSTQAHSHPFWQSESHDRTQAEGRVRVPAKILFASLVGEIETSQKEQIQGGWKIGAISTIYHSK